jgi:hypothetical protein
VGSTDTITVQDLLRQLDAANGELHVPDPAPTLRAAYRRAIHHALADGVVPDGVVLRHTGRDRGDLTIRLIPAAVDVTAAERSAPVPVPAALSQGDGPSPTPPADTARARGSPEAPWPPTFGCPLLAIRVLVPATPVTLGRGVPRTAPTVGPPPGASALGGACILRPSRHRSDAAQPTEVRNNHVTISGMPWLGSNPRRLGSRCPA